MKSFIVDAGPLVALFDRNDQYHGWAVGVARQIRQSLVTSEPVLTEALFLLSRAPNGPTELIAALQNSEFCSFPFRFEPHRHRILLLLEKYADLPSSLADVSLVCMAETLPNPVIWTTDSHFKTYRIFGNRRIPLIAP